MNNVVIGLGGCGTNVVKQLSKSQVFNNDINLYIIDSITANIDMDTINNIQYLCILADDTPGSGRNRDRGRAMYEFHESQGAFNEMYKEAENAKSPVLVITSAAGGTGSGSAVPVCKALMDRGVQVIPIIICPNKNDPAAFHLNANDLLIELGELGVATYSIFENRRGDADYTPVNQEVVNLIEIIFGKKYGKTDLDSIDDSDLDVILNTPGRLIAVQAETNSIPALQKEITRKVFSGFQPVWKPEDVGANTLMTAFALKSMFADEDFKTVFDGIRERIDPSSSEDSTVYDEYRNIVKDDNNGMATASLIIAGLPRSEIKEVRGDYKEATGLGDGIKKSKRPSFMNKKRASIVSDKGSSDSGNDVINKFKWK